MSGGKGGSTTSTVTIPEYIEAAAQRNLNKAERISQIGYTPYYGPDVAAFTPMQQAGFQNIANTAGAFGMAAPTTEQDIMGGMGPATTYAGGVQGYSSAPIYEQSLATLGQQRPGQKAYIDSFFIDPYAGGAAAGNFAPIDYTQYNTAAQDARAREAAGGVGGDLVSYPGAGGGNGSALSDTEIADYSQVIADSVGLDSFDPTVIAEEQMTPEQYDEYVSQPMSDAAQLAADDIYMNNLATSGSGQGSLFTGGMTGTTLGGDVAAGLNAVSNLPGLTGLLANEAAEALAPRNEYRNTDNSNRTAMETQLDYQAAQRAAGLASGAIPAFDPNDPSTWTTASGQNAMEAFESAATAPVTSIATLPTGTTLPTGSTVTNTYSGGFESRPSHSTDNDREFNAFYDTKIKDPVSGKMLTAFQLNNRINSPNLGKAYADANITSLDQILEPAPTAAAPQTSSASSSSQSSQTIKSGDTLSAIAKREGTTVNEIMKANPQIKDQNKIQAGAAITIPKAASAPVNSGSSGGSGDGGSSGGGGTVLCTAYASMGYLPADIWSLDTRYGIKRFRQDPVMVSGYRLWASPIAKFIKTDTLAAKAVRAALWPMVRVWAEEMAHQMKPEKYSGNKFGKLVMAMGEPFSYAVGATLLKRNAQKEL